MADATAETHDRFATIEELVNSVTTLADPAARSIAMDLIAGLLEFHGVGLARIVAVISQSGAAGAEMLQEIARDDLAASLLLLHGLHPTDLESRIKQALDKVRPQLRSHGGDVALLSIDDGQVRLQLNGNCHGCPSSSATLHSVIEEAIYAAAPDIAGLQVSGVDERAQTSDNFVPLEILQTNGRANR